MNRAIKEATVKHFLDEANDRLRSHFADIADAHDDARRLKAAKGFTPTEAIREAWTKEPESFRLDPRQQRPGLNI